MNYSLVKRSLWGAFVSLSFTSISALAYDQDCSQEYAQECMQQKAEKQPRPPLPCSEEYCQDLGGTRYIRCDYILTVDTNVVVEEKRKMQEDWLTGDKSELDCACPKMVPAPFDQEWRTDLSSQQQQCDAERQTMTTDVSHNQAHLRTYQTTVNAHCKEAYETVITETNSRHIKKWSEDREEMIPGGECEQKLAKKGKV